jgi:hypothetical protein
VDCPARYRHSRRATPTREPLPQDCSRSSASDPLDPE